jgi:hypothetical protein
MFFSAVVYIFSRRLLLKAFVGLAVASLTLIFVVVLAITISLGKTAESKSQTAIDTQMKQNMRKFSCYYIM